MKPEPKDAPPPTTHVLRPHHIALLHIMKIFFLKPVFRVLYPATSLILVHQLLLREITEISPPKSFKEIIEELRSHPVHESVGPIRDTIASLASVHHALSSPKAFYDFFNELPLLFLEKEDGPSPVFSRRSLFGFFARRCFISFAKLSYGAVEQLLDNYHQWLKGDSKNGYAPIKHDQLGSDYHIFKTQADKKEYSKLDSWILWEKGIAIGDDNIATENLRRYFEQHFHEGNDSGLRQHALLNLARMHFLRDEEVVCRKVLQEAIGVARTCNDKLTLQHCTSLLHRLPVLERGKRQLLNIIQPDLHPYEILNDVTKLVQISANQPLAASYERIVQAIALYDHWIDVQGAPFLEAEQYGQHAVQSVVWSMNGCSQIAEIEENIVTAFTEVGDDNNRLVVTLNRAYRRARNGKYEDAIASLLDPDVWRGLTLLDYNTWASEIWHILVLRASRRGQLRQFREFLQQKRPEGSFSPREYYFSAIPIGSIVRDSLIEVMRMLHVDQGHACVEQLLTALWYTEFQGRYGLYRTAVILLADVGLEFGMTTWCRRIIEEIMPQIIIGDDLEQRALACFTLARCITAAGNSSADALQECLPYLGYAEKDYVTLQLFQPLQDVQYFVSVVYHNLGMTTERDEAASRALHTQEERRKVEVVVIEPWLAEVWALVADVGAALASR